MITVGLFNFENGGLGADGRYDWPRLQSAFATVDRPPALLLFNEAKRFRDGGNVGLHGAAEALADVLHVPYVGVLGTAHDGGPLPPAIFYNPAELTLRRWWNPDDRGVFPDHRNIARFAVNASAPTSSGRRVFFAFVTHFDPRSAVIRRQQAELLDRWGSDQTPVIGGGDLNATASGTHLPQRDWKTADYLTRAHKARPVGDGAGTWEPDTDAVDHLIGAVDPATGQRYDGSGFHALAELAWSADPTQPIQPTTIHKPSQGAPLLIDWLLANAAMLPHVITNSYRVHRPRSGARPPSDHYLLTADLDL